MSLPAIRTALDLLAEQVLAGGEGEALVLPLHALQARGLTREDLTVHLERLRAINEVGPDDEVVEDACQRALEIVEGRSPHGLIWDAAHTAAALISQTLGVPEIVAALPYAVEPSDLLPPRPAVATDEAGARGIAERIISDLANLASVPTRADVYRAPKSSFTTRPAALLSFPDRLVLEALTLSVEGRLDSLLPAEVLWPRGRSRRPNESPSETVLGWTSRYVVKADVSHFYESIEHSTLATLLVRRLGMPVLRGRAFEALLDAVMGSSRGLPQGPPVSDVLSSAYLLPVDLALAATTPYVRFADDLFFPAETLGDGRRILRHVEHLASDVGLALNSAKTLVMRRETYEEGLRTPEDDLSDLNELITNAAAVTMALGDPGEITGLLQDLGVSEEQLWGLFYHQTLTLEDVMSGVVDERREMLFDKYAGYLRAAADMLESGAGHGHLDLVEKIAREGLSFLATSPTDRLDARQLAPLQRWLPTLVPRIVEYLGSRDTGSHEWVTAYIVARLVTNVRDQEWETAWLAYAATLIQDHSEELLAALAALCRDSSAGGLARAEALRALAHHGGAYEELWMGIVDSLSPALRMEHQIAVAAAGIAPRRSLTPLEAPPSEDPPRDGPIQ